MAQPHKVNLFYLIKYTVCYYLPTLTTQVTASAKVIRKLLIVIFAFLTWIPNLPPPLCPGLLCQDFPLQISLCKEFDGWKIQKASPEETCFAVTDQQHLTATLASLWKPQTLCVVSSTAPSIKARNN